MQEMPETLVPSLGRQDPLEEEMATCFSILAWKFHGQGAWVDYSPQSCKESEAAEHTGDV